MSAVDRLNAERLRADLGHITLGRQIVTFEQSTSTNDIVLQMAGPDMPEGLVVFSEYQTAGRGQRGNLWESAAGKGLWFSVLLRPEIAPKDSIQITRWSAQIVAATLHTQFSLPTTIKLPNDVYVHERKLAGVLVEMRAQSHAPHIAILGMGVNVNQTPEDFSEEVRGRAVSIAMLRGETVDRHRLAIALLRELDRTYVRKFVSWRDHADSVLRGRS